MIQPQIAQDHPAPIRLRRKRRVALPRYHLAAIKAFHRICRAASLRTGATTARSNNKGCAEYHLVSNAGSRLFRDLPSSLNGQERGTPHQPIATGATAGAEIAAAFDSASAAARIR